MRIFRGRACLRDLIQARGADALPLTLSLPKCRLILNLRTWLPLLWLCDMVHPQTANAPFVSHCTWDRSVDTVIVLPVQGSCKNVSANHICSHCDEQSDSSFLLPPLAHQVSIASVKRFRSSALLAACPPLTTMDLDSMRGECLLREGEGGRVTK